MPFKWKLFAVANYLLIVILGFLLLGAMRFSAEKIPAGESGSFMLFMTSLLVCTINLVFNLIIFHRYLPDKSFGPGIRILYIISAILYCIALIVVLINLGEVFVEEISNYSTGSFTNFLLVLLSLISICGIFIFINQLLVRKFIESNLPKNTKK